LALEALAAHPGLGPVQALQLCHQALVGSRGAVISIASIDAQQKMLSYAGVGNVEARLWRPDHEERPMIYRGIVGSTMRTLRTFEFPLGDRWLLLMYSDGIRDRFRIDELQAQVGAHPQALADAILEEWSRPTDDATILVAGPAA
jgi:hypothetical protein